MRKVGCSGLAASARPGHFAPLPELETREVAGIIRVLHSNLAAPPPKIGRESRAIGSISAQANGRVAGVPVAGSGGSEGVGGIGLNRVPDGDGESAGPECRGQGAPGVGEV